MSIPPLVCNTPPPFEQCEDDKYTEEFDLQYNHVFDAQESPWGSNDSTHSDFGNFTANFEETASQSQTEKLDIVIEDNNDKTKIVDNDHDKDFKEFDDLKSSAAEVRSDDNIPFDDFKSSTAEIRSDDNIQFNDLKPLADEVGSEDNIQFNDLKSSAAEVVRSDGNIQFDDFKSSAAEVRSDNKIKFDDLKPSVEEVRSEDNIQFDDFKSSAAEVRRDDNIQFDDFNSSAAEVKSDDNIEFDNLNLSTAEATNGDNIRFDDFRTSPEVRSNDNNIFDDFKSSIAEDRSDDNIQFDNFKSSVTEDDKSNDNINLDDFKTPTADVRSYDNILIVDSKSSLAEVRNDNIQFDDFKSSANVVRSDDIIHSDDFKPTAEFTNDDNFEFDEFKSSAAEVKSNDDVQFDDFKTSATTEVVRSDDNIPFDDFNLTAAEVRGDDNVQFEDFKSSAAEVRSDDNIQFDNFKSSAPKVGCDDNTQHVSVLNLQSSENENQVIESINKVLNCIFKKDAFETNEICEAKLDSELNETWGHLMETDVKQPYIVNWNNSLAQKTLLKALCIDSRNILFGPRWSYNMPKYAANLTTAPLQPQKQPSTSVTLSETTNPDKVASKPATWSDPFATNGQESCNNEGENAVIEPRPTDLDVFEATMSTKKDKIYSSTISVQPIRQINLPDTHIFTPTDSETPRSKTIHYDCSSAPTVLMPQTALASFKIDEKKPITPVDNATSNTDNDNEYWEFQDFKGTPAENIPPPLEKDDANNAFPKSNVTYQTQLLQPIKLEPVIPTLNWPDPGEIKETFDDFSDFVANSSSSAKVVIPEEHCKPANRAFSQAMSIDTDLKQGPSKSDSFDDEFDTFQSALPTKQTANSENNYSSVENKLESNKVHNHSSPVCDNHSEFECVFPNNPNIKSEDISFTNFTKPLAALSQPVDNINLKNPSSLGINSTNNSILQPKQTGIIGQVSIQSQQKSGQILQPLSLEGYSQINWPNPGIDLQDLSRFNPVETLPSLKTETSGNSKMGTPIHNQKTVVSNQNSDDDIWGEFVSSNPRQKQTQSMPKNAPALVEDDEWTDFVSSSSVKPQNGLNTISFNVHTNSNMQKSSNQSKFIKNNQIPLDIPSLNYITPKTGNHKSYNDKHFQNL